MHSITNRRTLLTGGTAAAIAAMIARPSLAQDAGAGAALPPLPTPEQWAASPDLEHVCLSPDGNHIAYIKEEGDAKVMYEYNIAQNAFRKFNIGNAKIEGLMWLDSSHILVSTFNTAKIDMFAGGRDTFTIASIYNIDAKSVNVLFDHVQGFSNFVIGEVHPITVDGTLQITAATYPINADEFKYLYRFSLDKATDYHLMDRAPWGTRDWVLAPDGTLIGRSVYYDKARTWVLQYNTGTGWKDIHTVKADLSYPSLIGLGRDGKSLVVWKEEGDNGGHYYEVSPDGVFSEPLPNKGTGSGPMFDQKTMRMCGYTTYDGWIHYDFDDPAMKALVAKAQKAMDGYRMQISDYADDPSKMIVYSEGDDDAGTYYFIDFTSGKTITIGSAYPNIPVEWLAIRQAITYKAADGTPIEAYLTLPAGRDAKALPLVVLPHGGPVARDGMEYDRESQAYASRGYAVLQPNYRGSSGYGEGFVVAGYGQWGRKMQTDLSDGVRYLAEKGMVDPKRVCIVGASYGGYAALAGAAFDPGVYRCAVDVAGVSDFKTFMLNLQGYSERIDSALYRGEQQLLGDPSTWDDASPAKHADKINIPVLIVHGTDDTVVPFAQSTMMVSAMKSAGKDVTFVQYDHEDHWETNAKARADMYKIIISFIETHNPPAQA